VLEHKHSAHPRIVLRSLGRIESPLLSILLKASRAGHGTYFKHFQLFLDPAETAPGQPEPELIPLHTARSPSPDQGVHGGSDSAVPGWARASRYGPVRSGDSLSEIAFRLRRDKRFSNRQVMLSLYKTNPRAFVGGDINRLKRGAWLDVPEGEVVKTYGSAAAMRELSALLQPHAGTAASTSSKAMGPVAANVALKRPEPALRYSGTISVSGATARPRDLSQAADGVAYDARLKAIHDELMAGKLRMSDLGRSVADINHAVAGIKQDVASLRKGVRQDMESLKKDVATVQTAIRQLQPSAPVNIWMLILTALAAGMLGALIVIVLRKRSQPLSTASLDQNRLGTATAEAEQQPERVVADEVVQLLNRAEEQLGSCDFEQAEQTLDTIDQLNPDSVRAAVLRAQLYHETGRFEARNALINGISDSADRGRWEKFCTLLPSHVWNACFDGTPGANAQ